MVWPEPILHVDMDSFYVEVERLDKPGLVGRPVAVGGKGPRGVIASASYEARTYGVRSAQPTATALKLCPGLEVVAPSHDRYADVSADVFSIFRSFTPLVEGLSLDEAFLDVRGLRRHFPSAVSVGEAVRDQLRTELGLPASVGVAAVKFVAKLASEAAKPDGLRHVSVDEQAGFISALPASALWGVGPATLAALARLGVETVGDVAALPESVLVNALGPATGRHLHELAHGIDPRPVVADVAAKSISVEETFERDLESREVVETALLAHAQRLSGRLRRSGLRSRTVTLKVRWADFTTVTRSETLPRAVDGSRDLYRSALRLLETVGGLPPVRLLGLGGTGLEPAMRPDQLDLESDPSWVMVEDAVAEIRSKYGEDSVGPARLLDAKENDSPVAEP